MTKKDYRDVKEIVDKNLIEKQVDLLTDAIYDDFTIYKAAKDVNCNIDDVFNWIYRGSTGEKEFEDLAEIYWIQILPYINEGNRSLREGDSESLLKKCIDPPILGEYDFTYWKKWGLINKENKMLNLDDIKEIINKK